MTEPIRGAGQPSWPLSPYNIQVSYGASQSGVSVASQSGGSVTGQRGVSQLSSGGIARGTGADWFGPLDPLRPIAPPDIAGRRFDFPPGYNLVTQPRAYEPIGFAELRGFADAYDILRLVIETRKDQMERQRWRVRPRAASAKRRSAAIDPEIGGRIATIESFLHKPDGVTRWKTWLRSLLEDMFVIDAATLYCQRSRSGQLCALQQLDGSTIKRVIDDWGRTPQPYQDDTGAPVYPPAYQQVLKGLPAVNYSARDIIYRPRNVRAHRVYGYSPVQQVLMTVNIGLRRQLWQLDYFSEGSIPDALIGVPAGWTPDQIRQFQDYWDTEFAGDLARRRRAKFVPGDTAARVVQTKEPEHKDDFDEWLARIICFAFAVPPQWATKVMNRATADNQSAQSEQEGLEPTKEWVKDLIDQIIAEEFASPDLELHWLDEDEGDPETVLESRVKLGALTLNEMRDALGLDPFDNPAADRPMALTATGYVPIEAGASSSPAPSPTGLTRGSMPVRRSDESPFQKYNPDQPRVPAGNLYGGQWTSGSSSSNDPRVISDVTPDNVWIPGAHYASGIEEGEGDNRSRGGLEEGTPGQEARLAIAEARLQDALSQVRVVDSNWKPTPGIFETTEGEIADLEAQAQEAQNRLSELARVGIGTGPFAGESIPARGPSRNFTGGEREAINQIGAKTGCHTCGATEAGTGSGNFVADHQLPSALNPGGQAQRLYPQCILCSALQGGWVRYLKSAR